MNSANYQKVLLEGQTRLGIDVGGTFTDLVLIEDGLIRTLKVLSNPGKPKDSIKKGLQHFDVENVDAVVHGTTVATNAILERNGSRTALITTRGFRDILHIGRQNRPDIYAVEPMKNAHVIRQEDCFGVEERVDRLGNVVVQLNRSDLDLIIEELIANEVETCAVSLLFSFLNPDHERRIGTSLKNAGVKYVSLSSQIMPEFREYERTSTVALNAYVAPVMTDYLASVSAISSGALWTVQSNGGILTTSEAMEEPVRTILSGPAAGVVGARHMSKLSGFNNVLTFDMGGTSTDVCLCPGRLVKTNEGTIEDMPVSVSMIDVHTVGSGGGSIAGLDEAGVMRVGPRSAGAVPGPACYGLGGIEATVTDANVILKRIPTISRIGDGHMKLDYERAAEAIDGLSNQIPELAGLPKLDTRIMTARAIIDLANAQMEAALRLITVERGYDSREFTLVAFGGAGPLHVCELAERLRISSVMVPRHPGVLSAFGALFSDHTREYSKTVMLPGDRSSEPPILDLIEELNTRALADLNSEKDAVICSYECDIRYKGQSFAIRVPFDGNDVIAAIDSFHMEHERQYTFKDLAMRTEIVSIRLMATVPTELTVADDQMASGKPEVGSSFELVAFAEQETNTPVVNRANLVAGDEIVGPAIILEDGCTVLVPPNWNCVVDGHLALLICNRKLHSD